MQNLDQCKWSPHVLDCAKHHVISGQNTHSHPFCSFPSTCFLGAPDGPCSVPSVQEHCSHIMNTAEHQALWTCAFTAAPGANTPLPGQADWLEPHLPNRLAWRHWSGETETGGGDEIDSLAYSSTTWTSKQPFQEWMSQQQSSEKLDLFILKNICGHSFICSKVTVKTSRTHRK